MAGRCADSVPFRRRRLGLRKELSGLWLWGNPPHVAWLVVRTTPFHLVPSALTPPPSHGDHESNLTPRPAPHRVNHLLPWTGS